MDFVKVVGLMDGWMDGYCSSFVSSYCIQIFSLSVLEGLAGDLGHASLHILAHLLGDTSAGLELLLNRGLHRDLLADLLGGLLALDVGSVAGIGLSLAVVTDSVFGHKVDRLADLDLLALSLLIADALSNLLSGGGTVFLVLALLIADALSNLLS